MTVRAAVVRLVVRVLFVLVLAAVASVIAWNAPALVPLFALLAAGTLYALVRLLGAGAAAAPRRARAGGGY